MDATFNTLEYKYVVRHKETQELVSWEGLPGNRTLTIVAYGVENVALYVAVGVCVCVFWLLLVCGA